jgi:hypothetical protein
LAARKKAARKFYDERFNLRKLNEMEVRKQQQIEVANRFTALDNSSDSEDINRAGRTLKRITKPELKRV